MYRPGKDPPKLDSKPRNRKRKTKNMNNPDNKKRVKAHPNHVVTVQSNAREIASLIVFLNQKILEFNARIEALELLRNGISYNTLDQTQLTLDLSDPESDSES